MENVQGLVEVMKLELKPIDVRQIIELNQEGIGLEIGDVVFQIGKDRKGLRPGSPRRQGLIQEISFLWILPYLPFGNQGAQGLSNGRAAAIKKGAKLVFRLQFPGSAIGAALNSLFKRLDQLEIDRNALRAIADRWILSHDRLDFSSSGVYKMMI